MKQQAKTWAEAAGIRALKTAAQAAVATIGTTSVLTSVDWTVVTATAALAGILSLLTSVAGLPEVGEAEEEAAAESEEK